MADAEYSMFLRKYAKRINECDAWQHSLAESYEIYKEKGEDLFLTKLEEKEDFNKFCYEYYSFLREHYNACGGMMWDEFELFRSEFNSDYNKYWKHLRSQLEER
jgi:hypothetical protein